MADRKKKKEERRKRGGFLTTLDCSQPYFVLSGDSKPH